MRLTRTDGWWQNEPVNLPVGSEPIGYAWMVKRRSLDVMPHHRWSFVGAVGSRTRIEFQQIAWEVFPKRYLQAGLCDQLEFALRYDGLNLEILSAWFATLALDEIEQLEAWVRASPTSAYARRAWFLFEFLTGRLLDLPDSARAPYVPLADPAEYYVRIPAKRSRRHRVDDNLLGDVRYCPLVRRTPRLKSGEELSLHEEIRALYALHDADLFDRAANFLFTKETRSSFELESERPSTDRTRRFVAVLRSIADQPALGKTELVRLQNLIVTDRRNRDLDWRRTQVYVSLGREVHFIAPRPDELPDLMSGWLEMVGQLVECEVQPVVAAAVASFGFVYLHPFNDGNGRLHRLLIHYVLARRGFVAPGLLIPVSATMLARKREYDDCLEQFSQPLMVRIPYEMDSMGIVEVARDSSSYYRYPDLTAQTEALLDWLEVTVRTEMPQELRFLLAWREARQRLDQEVELPDPKANHFIARCIEGKGRLSKTRRDRDFGDFTPDELSRMEEAVRVAMRAQGMEVIP